MVETVTAAVVGSAVLIGTLTIFLATASSWARGQTRIFVENDARVAVDGITNQLMDAMRVTVDADGKGLTYEVPTRDANGNIAFTFPGPALGDGVQRRIFYRVVTTPKGPEGQIVHVDNRGTRILARNVVLSDPAVGDATYRPFTANIGTTANGLTVLLVVRQESSTGKTYYGRRRETVQLRNVPHLTH